MDEWDVGQYVLYADHLEIVESLRKQLEEAGKIVEASSYVIRNSIQTINDREREIHELRSSVDAEIERAIRFTLDMAAPEDAWETLADWKKNILVASLTAQLKEQKK